MLTLSRCLECHSEVIQRSSRRKDNPRIRSKCLRGSWSVDCTYVLLCCEAKLITTVLKGGRPILPARARPDGWMLPAYDRSGQCVWGSLCRICHEWKQRQLEMDLRNEFNPYRDMFLADLGFPTGDKFSAITSRDRQGGYWRIGSYRTRKNIGG